jgi:diguanylate cyclase (GGDEF)-like protein
MFSALLEQALRSAKRYERKLAVLFIDLDGFKAVNDRLGHEAGDSILKQVAARFREAVRESDVVVRLGGDEFVVLAQNLSDRDGVRAIAQKILGAAVLPVQVAEQECRISASIGIGVFPDDGDSEQLLMKNADRAMYAAKREGKNAFRFYS